MKSRSLVARLCGLFIVFAVSQFAAAQAISNAVSNGTVTDAGGRTVANAAVTVRSLDTNQTFSAAANERVFESVALLASNSPDETGEDTRTSGYGFL
jgi:hypothetical protein